MHLRAIFGSVGSARLGLVMLVSLAIGMCGCLERKEHIRIARDGRVRIELNYHGEPQEFQTADALPGPDSGWQLDEHREVNNDGKETLTQRSERNFSAGEALPANFAPAGDPDADLYLQFPTRVWLEQRTDGTYVHFRREYVPRPWAYVEYWQHLIDENVQDKTKKPLEELSPEERESIIKAVAGFEFFKQIELFRVALDWAGIVPVQDAWMRARTALLKVADETDWDSVVQRIVEVPEKDRGAAFETESNRLLAQAQDAFLAELTKATSLTDAQINALSQQYDRAKKQYQITSELGGHAFEVEVEMPGTIVAHNAENATDTKVTWEFDGKAFRDRPCVLMATSKLNDRSDAKPQE